MTGRAGAGGVGGAGTGVSSTAIRASDIALGVKLPRVLKITWLFSAMPSTVNKWLWWVK